MKNVVKMMLVGASFLVASPVWATCNLAGSANPIDQSAIGLTSPSTPAQIAVALKGRSEYPAKDCSVAEIEATLKSANSWNTNQVIPLDYRFSIPLLVPAPASAPVMEASAPAAVVAPPVVPTVRPSTPVVKAAEQKVVSLEAKRVPLVRREAALKNAFSAGGLTPAERKMINEASAAVASIDSKIEAAKTELKTYIDDGLKKKANVGDSYTKEQTDAKFATKQEFEKQIKDMPVGESLSGWMLWLIGLGIAAAIGLGIFNFWRKPGVTKDEFNQKFAEAKVGAVSVTALADIENLKSAVAGLTSRFVHDVKKINSGEQATLLPAIIRQMEEGQTFDYHVMVDGTVITFDAHVVQRTPSGDALIKIDQLKKPVTAKSLFAAVAGYVEAGGELPILKLVQTA